MSLTFFIIIGVVLLISLFMYIIARIRMSKEKLVLTAGRMDVTLLMISPLLAILGALIWHFFASLSIVSYILWFITFICIALSIMNSIIENKNSGWDIAYSIGAKVFILITTVFIILFSMIALLGYMVYFIIKQFTKSDNEVEQDSQHKFSIPQYHKFMNAYVGIKDSQKAQKMKAETVKIEEADAEEIIEEEVENTEKEAVKEPKKEVKGKSKKSKDKK